MKKITTILTLLLSFISALSLIAQDENYDAVYRSLTKEYTLNPDGSSDFRLIKTMKLQNYRSFHRLYGETFIVYNPDFQTLRINQAYTIMADGKKVVAPANAFNEVLPGFAAHAPAFNRLREMVVTHTGLEIGATVYLDYRIHTAKRYDPAFMGSALLNEEQPVNELKIILRIPENQPLYYRLFNSSEKPSESTEEGYKVYAWSFSNLPATLHEPLQQNAAALYPNLVFSSLSDYGPLAGFFAQQKAFQFQLTTEMTDFVATLASGGKKKSEVLFAIQEAVVKDMNLYPVPEEYAGYRLRTPEEVWQSNGGTAAEKAVLLTALLRQAGIQAHPVMIFRGSRFDTRIGNLTTVEEWAVQTEIPELGVTCLSVKQVNAFDLTAMDPGGVFMVLTGGQNVQLVYPQQKRASLSLKGIFTLDPEKTLSGELSGSASGPALPYLSLARSDDKLKHYFRGAIASAKIASATLSGLTPEGCSFTCNLTRKDALTKAAGLYYFAIPSFSTGVNSWDIGQLSLKRETPVELPSAIEESYTLTLSLPGSLKLLSGEQEIRITNKAGSFSFIVRQKENVIQVQKELNVSGKSIGTKDYPEFKELMDSWSLWQTNNLILGY